MYPIPLAPFPGEGGYFFEGAAHLRGALSVTCGDSSPKGGAKAYFRLHPH